MFKEFNLKLPGRNSPLIFNRVIIVALALRENIWPGILLSFFWGIAK